MSKHTDRVRIEEVDWPAVFPWVRLFGAFRMAVAPSKLATSLLLVVLLYVLAMVVDPLAGRAVHEGEVDRYRAAQAGLVTESEWTKWIEDRDAQVVASLREQLKATANFNGDITALTEAPSPQGEVRQALIGHYDKAYADIETDRKLTEFDEDWETRLRQVRIARHHALAKVDALTPRKPLMTAFDEFAGATQRLAKSLVTFNLGWSSIFQSPSSAQRHPMSQGDDAGMVETVALSAVSLDSTTTLAALHDLFIVIPGWLWHHHRAPLLLWLALSLPLVALLGGSVARMAAMQATRDERIGLREAMAFVKPRWWTFLLSPLAPLLMILGVAALMGVGGFLLFNPPAWGIDILGGLLFAVAILCGLLIAGLLILTVMGVHLVYPAAAVNGADLFDAVARAFNHVLNRPWRWLLYNLIALVYGAFTYLLLLLILSLAIWAVHAFVGQWVFTTTDLGESRFDVILPTDTGRILRNDIDYASLDWSGRIAAFLIHCWLSLLLLTPVAYLVSYYLCVNTWVYVLLRRDADGIEHEDVLIDPPYDPNAPVKSTSAAESTDASKEDEEAD